MCLTNYNLIAFASSIVLSGSLSDDKVINSNVKINNDFDLAGRKLEINGNLYLNSGTLNLNKGNLKINGDLIQPGGTLYVNGGSLNIKGSYKIQSLKGGSSSGILKMVNKDDFIMINGDFLTRSTKSHKGFLTNGILRLHGNFSQYYTGSTLNFRASGYHKVMLYNEEFVQTVMFETAGDSSFNILEVDKPIEFYNFIEKHVKPNVIIYTVALNQKVLDFDVEPINLNGRILVPLRDIFEEMGAQVNWDNSTKTITANKGDRTIKLQVNNKRAYINDIYFDIDVAPKIVNGRTMVPLRFVCESIGSEVEWDAKEKKIRISYDELYPKPILRTISADKPVELILNGKPANSTLITTPIVVGYETVYITLDELKKLFSDITFEVSKDFNSYNVADITAFRNGHKFEFNIGSYMAKFYSKENSDYFDEPKKIYFEFTHNNSTYTDKVDFNVNHGVLIPFIPFIHIMGGKAYYDYYHRIMYTELNSNSKEFGSYRGYVADKNYFIKPYL